MTNNLFIKLICFSLVIYSGLVFSQKRLYAGLVFTADGISDEYVNSYFIPGGGITYDLRITKHSGIEGGLLFRNYISSLYIVAAGNPYPVQVAERYISVPLLYKFSSKIINLAAGPNFDFYVGWKQKPGIIAVNDYSPAKTFFLGLQVKASKQINLSRQLLLEPALHFIPLVNSGYRYYTGGAINLRYLLKKRVEL